MRQDRLRALGEVVIGLELRRLLRLRFDRARLDEAIAVETSADERSDVAPFGDDLRDKPERSKIAEQRRAELEGLDLP